mgnify:CR=1 FL=1
MKKIILSLVLFTISLFPLMIFADELPVPAWKEKMGKLIKDTPIVEEESLMRKVFTIIQYILSFLGVIALIVIIIGGYLWMTAGGNEEKVNKAKRTLIHGVIGLGIILLAYAITAFVITKIHTLGRRPR